jgi:7-dehydrocholesterol reductase
MPPRRNSAAAASSSPARPAAAAAASSSPSRAKRASSSTGGAPATAAAAAAAGWGGNSGESVGIPMPAVLRNTVFPLALMAVTFPLAVVLVYADSAAQPDAAWLKPGAAGGHLWGAAPWPPAPASLAGQLLADPLGTVRAAFGAALLDCGSETLLAAARMLAVFVAFQLFLMRAMPGREHRGPVSPSGHVPVYCANGLQSFCAALSAYVLAVHVLHLASAAEVLRLYPHMLAIMSVASLAFCFVLYLKGLYAPSGPDHGSSGNAVMDLFWGTELYPRILGFDVKIFTNCRFGMMSWALLPVAFFGATAELVNKANPAESGWTNAQAVNVVLQLAYVAKFFAWEMGYTSTLDVMHDRAGYYICWGCLVWVPSVYVVHSHHLAHQVLLARTGNKAGAFVDMSDAWAAACLLAGLAMIWWNYDCDLQRSFVRGKGGKCELWGQPAKVLRAPYVTEKGERKENLLLYSGWWGMARHIHYVPEILAAVCWTLPAASSGQLLPWFYVAFLIILLTDRAFRDNARCEKKYGKVWAEYTKLVPYMMVPYVI